MEATTNITSADLHASNAVNLLLALAEDLKRPLVSIAHSIEAEGVKPEHLQRTTRQALELIDSYILGLSGEQQTSLELETVGVTSVLYDIAHVLTPLAKQQKVNIKVASSGRCKPILVNRRAVQSLYVLLGKTLITNANDQSNEHSVSLAFNGSRSNNLAIGIYSNQIQIGARAFSAAQKIMGSSLQPLPRHLYDGGTMIFIANSIAQKLGSKIVPHKHKGMQGFAAHFSQSHQLSLV